MHVQFGPHNKVSFVLVSDRITSRLSKVSTQSKGVLKMCNTIKSRAPVHFPWDLLNLKLHSNLSLLKTLHKCT